MEFCSEVKTPGLILDSLFTLPRTHYKGKHYPTAYSWPRPLRQAQFLCPSEGERAQGQRGESPAQAHTTSKRQLTPNPCLLTSNFQALLVGWFSLRGKKPKLVLTRVCQVAVVMLLSLWALGAIVLFLSLFPSLASQMLGPLQPRKPWGYRKSLFRKVWEPIFIFKRKTICMRAPAAPRRGRREGGQQCWSGEGVAVPAGLWLSCTAVQWDLARPRLSRC